ncbi:MAG: hypothetical protein AAF368_12465 [Planctomycetota bacterium]
MSTRHLASLLLPWVRLSCALALLLGPLAEASGAQSADRKGSPFDGLRWTDGEPEVQVDKDWFEPVAVHGVPIAEILEFCEQRWPGRQEKRFGEDLVEALNLMGHELPAAIDLELRDLASGEIVTRTEVAVTREKRFVERAARAGRGHSSPPRRRVSRRRKPPKT